MMEIVWGTVTPAEMEEQISSNLSDNAEGSFRTGRNVRRSGRSDTLLEGLNTQVLARAAAPGTNANVFGPVPGEKLVPHALYFFYYTMDDSAFSQQAYFWPEGDPNDRTTWQPISPTRAKEIAAALTLNARQPLAAQSPQPIALAHIDDCQFTEICYVVFVIDEQNWAFMQSVATGNAAVVCDVDGGSTPNHSFYDAELFDINVGSGSPSAVLMVNYMKDENGNYLGNGISEPFNFKLFFKTINKQFDVVPIWVDPGGTNLGPPRAPPP